MVQTSIKLILFLVLAMLQLRAAVVYTNIGTSWIQVPANSGIGPNITNVITISAWINRHIDRGSTKATLIDMGNSQPSAAAPVLYDISVRTNFLIFWYATTISNHMWATAAPATNTLAHIAFTFTYGNGTSAVFYVNGSPVSGVWVTGDGSGIPTTNSNSMQIGCDAAGTPFVGLIDEVAVWNSILTPNEISALARTKQKRTPLLISPSTLVCYYPLDNFHTYFFAADVRVIDMGPRRLHGSFEGSLGMVAWPETFLSYPPNE